MKQQQFNTIEANSSHDLKVKISRDAVKKLKAPDTNKMYSISAPSLRAVFFKKTLALANKKAKSLKKERPEMIIVINAPK